MPRTPLSVLLPFVLSALPVVASGAGAQGDPIRKAMADGRYADAREILEGGDHGRSEAERLELLTEVCNAQSDHVEGVRYGKKAVAASPDSSNAHFQYAVAVRNKMRNGSKMKAMFAMGTYKKALRRALELDAENADALEEQIGFLIQAPGIAGGDTERARELIPELKALDKSRGLQMEVLLENSEGDPARAAELLRAAVDEDPDDLRLRNRYAVQLQKQEQFREADIEFKKIAAAEDDPFLSRLALYQRARTRILGRFEQDKAVGMLEQYLEVRTEDQPRLPTRSNAYWRMGNAHEQLGRSAEARVAYAKALELDPENAQAKKSLEALPR